MYFFMLPTIVGIFMFAAFFQPRRRPALRLIQGGRV